MAGRTGLVVGVANKRSLAWAIAAAAATRAGAAAGAHLPERAHGARRAQAGRDPRDPPASWPSTSQDDAQSTPRWPGAAEGSAGSTSSSTPSPSPAPRTWTGRFADTSREGFSTALDVSAYSLVALAARVEPHMRARGGGSIITLTYLASERAMPGYNVMGVAKAALEVAVRYLAWDLGDGGIRVNRHLGRPGAHAGRAGRARASRS